MGLHKHTLRGRAREPLHAHSRCRLSLDAMGAREPRQIDAALSIRRPIRTYILYRRLPYRTRQSRTLLRGSDIGARARDRGDIRDGRKRAAAVMGERARRWYGEYGRAEEVARSRADTAGCSAVVMVVILLLSRRSAESHPLEAQRNHTATRLASKSEAGVLHFALELQLSASKPALELFFCPIAARDEESAALFHEGLNLFPVSFADPTALRVFFLRQADGVECALVQYDVEASA